MGDRLAGLRLDTEALLDVRAALSARIAEGLAREGAEIRALLAYVPPPPAGLTGRALVIDMGGTNVRAAVVELSDAADARARIALGPVVKRLPTRNGKVDVTKDELFAFQAKLAATLSPGTGLPVGYCFSYPTEILPDGDGRLLRWTKELAVEGVEGTCVGAALGAALTAEGLAPGRVRVLNDTVASMLGGALAHATTDGKRRPSEAFIGLIVGTGTNMSAFFPKDRVPKLPESARALAGVSLAVNLESGNFAPPHLTEWDDALDAASENRGAQRFEKAVSGHYLPYLFQRVVDRSAFDPTVGSRALVELRGQDADPEGRDAARAILERSADLTAAAIAALVDHYASDLEIGVLAEGSLVWNDPEYAPRVRARLDTLVGPGKVELLRLEDANLVGAAAAALA